MTTAVEARGHCVECNERPADNGVVCRPCTATIHRRLREENARRHRDGWLEAIGLPRAYRAASFGDLQTQALELVRSFVESGGVQRGRLLGVLGPTGIGKTHAAAALHAEQLVDLGAAQRYLFASALTRRLSSYRDAQAAIDEAVAPRLLVLDDLPVPLGEERAVAGLEEILVAREAEQRATVLCSNGRPDELRQVLGDRLLDRFRSWGVIHALTGPSLRRAPAAT